MKSILKKIKTILVACVFLGVTATGMAALANEPALAAEGSLHIANTGTAVQSLSFNERTVRVESGKTVNLKLNVSPANADKSKITWSSRAPQLATVKDGKVTALKTGITIIDAKMGDKKASVTVLVTSPKKEATVSKPLKSISLNKEYIALDINETFTLSVSYNPVDTTDPKTVKWSSDIPGIVTVKDGKVTAKKSGMAYITANVGGKEVTCRVRVINSKAKESYKNVSDAYTLTNTFRTAKANQWYINADNKTKTYTYGLKALTRDAALEKIAQKRAKEQWTQYFINGTATHDRLDGSKAKTAYPASAKYLAENLSFNRKTAKEVILTGWAETNNKYDKQGHRRNMLDKNAKRVGIACYEKDGLTCWAMSLGW